MPTNHPHTVIVHGYGIDIKSAFTHPEGENAGFTAFDRLIRSGEVVIYRWSLKWQFGFWQGLNPMNMITIYHKERSLLDDPTFFDRLHAFLLEHQPTNLVGHSLGAEVILRYMKYHNPPASVKRIITTQADMSSFASEIHEKLALRIQHKLLVWENYYCWWDPALLISAMMYITPRAGIFGCWNPLVKNKFYPLFIGYNLHVSTMKDVSYVKHLQLRAEN